MPSYVTRAGMAAGLVLAVIVAASGQEQPKGAVTIPESIPGTDKETLSEARKLLDSLLAEEGGGAATCNQCHALQNPRTDPSYRSKVGPLVHLTEATTWAAKDLHPLAFNVLKEPAGQQMSRLLGKDVTKMKECLACHATDRKPTKPWQEKSADDFFTAGGVACESCHGSDQGDWYRSHVAIAWRNQEPAEKMKQGQIDVRNPIVRATLCASCHVGNAAEGKVVTHEMYAAGHPPLPTFELATFSLQEPMHWWPPEQVPYFSFVDKNIPDGAQVLEKLFHYRVGEKVDTRLVAVGSLVSLRDYMQTIADESAVAAKQDSVIDLAHFDCAACHHDLKRPSWRQQRGYRGVAGRPVMKNVSIQLVEAVLTTVSPKELSGFTAAMDRVHRAFDARPFGDSPQLAKEAAAFVSWSNQAIDVVMKTKFTEEKASQLRDAIAKAVTEAGSQTGYAYDYDTARLMTWAYQVIDSELQGTIYTDYPNLPQFKQLDELLKLRLKDRSAAKQVSVEATLPERLKLSNDFNPSAFFPLFGELRKQ